jgi:3-dehydroquinate synthase
MILEGYLSFKTETIQEAELEDIVGSIFSFYPKIKLPEINELEELLIQDKKNTAGLINFSLLKEIGKCGYDTNINRSELSNSIDYYGQINKSSFSSRVGS